MLTQILTSSIWQTLGVAITIATTITVILLFIRSPKRSKKEKIYITVFVLICTVIVLGLAGLGIYEVSAPSSKGSQQQLPVLITPTPTPRMVPTTIPTVIPTKPSATPTQAACNATNTGSTGKGSIAVACQSGPGDTINIKQGT